jgi:hypothetical protein
MGTMEPFKFFGGTGNENDVPSRFKFLFGQ